MRQTLHWISASPAPATPSMCRWRAGLSRGLASLYLPDDDISVTRWPGGSRHLTVKIDRVAVDSALQALLNGPVDSPVAFSPTMPLKAGAARDWVRLLLMVHRQLECPDSLMRHSVVSDPLVEALIHGLLLA